ncbi:MAG TPA: aminotransferase class IV [Tepidisphaeraceae bacterium]|jgi:branched-subunit amino acid aminotransferase/4-amino-4-deoxychorismate lyase|nr:aminotransferase class IV [Tepidisphaeraceae bacterium]
MSIVWINDAYVSDATAHVPIRDTGLLHAAGVFTTMKAVGGAVVRLPQHLARLRQSCEALAIPLPYDDAALIAIAGELLAQNGLTDARMRLTVTRGSAATAGDGLSPTVFFTAAEQAPYLQVLYERGMTVVLIDDQKLNPYDVQAGHKTLNYLSRLAALRSANVRSAGEALWFDVHNYLQSGSISNVFIVKDRVLITPPTPADMRDEAIDAATPYPRSCVLPGITRQAVIDTARAQGITVKTAAIDVNALLAADEVFLTNSMMDVMPVCRIERSAIGDDRPGPTTKQLATALAG